MASDARHNYDLIGLSPKWHPYFDRHDVNLESHQLLWADIKLSELEDENEIFSTLTKFRQLVNYTKAFDHWNNCLRHIEKCHVTFTFLVCSALYAKVIVPKLWVFRKTNVWKVYIYCEDELFDMEKIEFFDKSKASNCKNPYLKYQKFEISFLENLLGA
jgi:hypothetical protein